MPSKTNKEIIDGKKTFSDFLTEKIKKIEGLIGEQPECDGICRDHCPYDCRCGCHKWKDKKSLISQVLSILK